MALLIFTKRYSDDELREAAKEMETRTEQFFKDKPRRRVCNVGAWYGQIIRIRRGHVKEDVQAALDKELKKNAEKR